MGLTALVGLCAYGVLTVGDGPLVIGRGLERIGSVRLAALCYWAGLGIYRAAAVLFRRARAWQEWTWQYRNGIR